MQINECTHADALSNFLNPPKMMLGVITLLLAFPLPSQPIGSEQEQPLPIEYMSTCCHAGLPPF